MPSVNTVTLMGHLGQDAETQFTPSGVAVTRLSVATTRRWPKTANPQGPDDWNEATDWFRVDAWRVSDKTREWLKKGNLVYVEGRLENQSWDDKETGQKRYATRVIARRLDFLREPFRSGPRDEEAPSGPEMPPPSDDDIPF